MKGIILAGGKGTRLYPMTLPQVNKHLLPVYDKPMIYYPISTLMISGIKEILIISTPESISQFESLLGNGNQIGCNIKYAVQENPTGIADAFIVGKDFIGKESVALILGDNIFYGSGLGKILRNNINNSGATIFPIFVNDPTRFGVLEFNQDGEIISIEEKPKVPKSNFAIPGIYFYDNSVIKKSERLNFSDRGEKEITDLNKLFLNQGELNYSIFPRGITWLDTGTPESLSDSCDFVRIVEKTSNKKIACIEEVALRSNFISIENFKNSINNYNNSLYGDYLKKVLLEFEKIKIKYSKNNSGILHFIEDINFEKKIYLKHIESNSELEITFDKLDQLILIPLIQKEEFILTINDNNLLKNNEAMILDSKILKVSSNGKNTLLIATQKQLDNSLDLNLKFINRLFFVNVLNKGIERGFHAHKKSNQILYCISDSFEISRIKNNRKDTKFLDPFDSVEIPSLTWQKLKF